MGILLHTGQTVADDEAQGAPSLNAQAKESRMRRIEPFARIITVSRECCAGGSRVGARVAAELGFKLWDQELVAHLARKADVDLDVIRGHDERPRDLLDDVVAGPRLFGRLSGGRFRSLLARVVAELAERGGAVIVGRGANFLIPSEQALRVRLICPERERIERCGDRERLAWPKASEYVRERDRDRVRFIKRLSGEDESDPSHYDLVLNTADLSEAVAARLIVSAHEARFGARDHRSEERARSLSL